jgi:hypothetical protein
VSAINVRQRKLGRKKGTQGSIDTCSVENCSKSGQWEAWILDHKYLKWLLCTEHKDEILDTLNEILPDPDDTAKPDPLLV